MLSLGNLFNSVYACGDHVLQPMLDPEMRQKKVVDVGPAAGCSAGCRPAVSDTGRIRLLCQLIFRRCIRPRRRVIHLADVSQTLPSRFTTTKTSKQSSRQKFFFCALENTNVLVFLCVVIVWNVLRCNSNSLRG